jgi:hypothetical protein
MNAYEEWKAKCIEAKCSTCGYEGMVYPERTGFSCYICPRLPRHVLGSTLVRDLTPVLMVMLDSQLKVKKPRVMKPKTPKGPQGYLVAPRRK